MLISGSKKQELVEKINNPGEGLDIADEVIKKIVFGTVALQKSGLPILEKPEI